MFLKTRRQLDLRRWSAADRTAWMERPWRQKWWECCWKSTWKPPGRSGVRTTARSPTWSSSGRVPLVMPRQTAYRKKKRKRTSKHHKALEVSNWSHMFLPFIVCARKWSGLFECVNDYEWYEAYVLKENGWPRTPQSTRDRPQERSNNIWMI